MLALALLLAAGVLRAQTCVSGELRAIVIDSQESPVPGAIVRLKSEAAALDPRSTEVTGLADFEKIPCGTWTVTVEADGFDPVTKTVELTNALNSEIRVIVNPKMHTESVDVRESAPPVEQSASENNELHPAEVKTLPTNPGT
ncbi:MAG TPA: carboxypeptidase-like regulatory domain-containing protein, partial [Bryobacteraceae bacterium]|nr:carboxypeptidase-like regulatory domain-containing protein [Bryobacteraceae bacterium]